MSRFLIVPQVGTFFIDIANTLVIQASLPLCQTGMSAK
jgi:sodium--glutamate symport carrier gltS